MEEVTIHARGQTWNNEQPQSKRTTADCAGYSQGKIQVALCYGSNCVPPKGHVEVLSLQYLEVYPYLETGPLQMESS